MHDEYVALNRSTGMKNQKASLEDIAEDILRSTASVSRYGLKEFVDAIKEHPLLNGHLDENGNIKV